MKTNHHLTTYQLTLTTLSPMFIGGGESLTKKEYVYDSANKQVIIVEPVKLYQYLERKNLASAFENYLQEPKSNLFNFFRQNKIMPKDYHQFARYQLGDDGDIGGGNLRDVHCFVKDAYGLPYIPGSSVKGAIRTAIAMRKLYSKEPRPKYEQSLHQTMDQPQKYQRDKQFAEMANNIETALFHREIFPNSQSKNMINSLMRGIIIHDSAPIPVKHLCLIQKIEANMKGEAKPLPIFREALRPGVQISFQLTLDQYILKDSGVDIGTIQKAIEFSYRLQQKWFYNKYPKVEHEAPADNDIKCIYLGGGVGYMSKTYTYPLLGEEAGLKTTARLLSQQFDTQKRNHKHKLDHRLGVSPHIRKLTKYKRQYYEMGKCRIDIT